MPTNSMMMLLGLASAAAQSPLGTSCKAVKEAFKGAECCGDVSKSIDSTPAFCPSVDKVISYEEKRGMYNPCPEEEIYYAFKPENPIAAGYAGCVGEVGLTPCGVNEYFSYTAEGGCVQEATIKTAIQVTRGGSPSMSEDMLRLTGEPTLPTLTYGMLPMSYPAIRGSSAATSPEMLDITVTWKKFMKYFGSTLESDNFVFYPTYGAEQGMVMAISAKILELASTTCNRDFYAMLEAPAYGYDWGQAISYAEMRASSFYAGEECPCYNTSTCNSKATLSISQVGWSPLKYPALPEKADAFGTMFTPDSEDPQSPWFQTNVIPGNPIGRFGPCKTPEKRCICDGVYWFPGFVSDEQSLPDIPCFSWAMSLTKIYSAQMRAGVMMILDYPEGVSAATSVMGKALAIANGLYSELQAQGQIQIMDKIMEKPFSDPTSWLHAMKIAQHEKWDVMDDAYSFCESKGVVKRTFDQPKYFGAYIFAYMMPAFQGYGKNIGAASNDFFKSVVGYDHFNYNWGWRGESTTAYVDSANMTVQDFVRTHMFRDLTAYEEEARRMKLVCGDFDAKVTESLLSVNEWLIVRSAERRRRRLAPNTKLSLEEKGMELKSLTRMSLKNALHHIETVDHSDKPLTWEYGMPADLEGMAM